MATAFTRSANPPSTSPDRPPKRGEHVNIPAFSSRRQRPKASPAASLTGERALRRRPQLKSPHTRSRQHESCHRLAIVREAEDCIAVFRTELQDTMATGGSRIHQPHKSRQSQACSVTSSGKKNHVRRIKPWDRMAEREVSCSKHRTPIGELRSRPGQTSF